MTERTVTVETTEVVEDSVAVCDHCGQEATAENSVSFVPLKDKDPLPDGVKGQLVRLKLAKDDLAVVRYNGEYDAIHYHTNGCLERATLAEVEPERAWREMEDSHGNQVKLAMTGIEIGIMVVGLVFVLLGLGVGSGITGSIAALVGFGFIGAGLSVGFGQASNPDDLLRPRE